MPRAFKKAETGTVEEARHQPGRPVQAREDGADLDPREHGGQTPRPARADEVVEPREAEPEHVM